MGPLEFLKEEFENVQRALKETLRHDYIPERSKEYYAECGIRLTELARQLSVVDPADADRIAGIYFELSQLANWISLIERSHLGEFSWPFAEQIRAFAKGLLAEENMAHEKVEPIVHVVAEGLGYRILYEPQVPSSSGERRFFVVAFPRSLKHHVLLHAIFGHELAHTAIHVGTTGGMLGAGAAGDVLLNQVLPALTSAGPIQDAAALNAWLRHVDAPQSVREALIDYDALLHPNAYQIHDYYRDKWLVELICDLFGLLLFGPAFVAAHCAQLKVTHPDPYEIELAEPTHPPYAVRRKMLVRAMQLLGWDVPVTAGGLNAYFNAEQELLTYVLDDPYHNWARFFTDPQLNTAIGAIQALFRVQNTGYRPPKTHVLQGLVQHLSRGVPPVLVDVSDEGEPYLHLIDISQTLYAGWTFWLGRRHLPDPIPKDFVDANRLCDLALLQQRAINLVVTPGEREWRSWVEKP
jgi:hypothetical protein